MIRPPEALRARLLLVGGLALLPATASPADPPRVWVEVEEEGYPPVPRGRGPGFPLVVRTPAGCPSPERAWVAEVGAALGEELRVAAPRFGAPPPARRWVLGRTVAPCGGPLLRWSGGPTDGWGAAGAPDPPWGCAVHHFRGRPGRGWGDVAVMLSVSPYAADGAGASLTWAFLLDDEPDGAVHVWRHQPEAAPVGACVAESRPEARARWDAAAADAVRGWARVLADMGTRPGEPNEPWGQAERPDRGGP